MPASPLRYDKFSYAVKRKPERETASPNGTAKGALDKSAGQNGLQPLSLTRDGFAIAEDGSLMSRVVSPPRWTPGNGPVVFASTAPTVAMSPSSVPMTPIRGGFAAPPASPATTVKAGSSAAAKSADPWSALVRAIEGKLSEDELVMLSWETVADLLDHFGIVNPVDVGRVQLVWRRKQDLVSGNDVSSDVATRGGASTHQPSEFDGEESLSVGGGMGAGTPPRQLDMSAGNGAGGACNDNVLVYSSPSAKPLEQKPIMQIAYGRPSSPRRKGRFVPDHKKPLQWTATSKIDTGRGTRPSSSRSGSRMEQ